MIKWFIGPRLAIVLLSVSGAGSAQHVEPKRIAVVNGESLSIHDLETAAEKELAGLEQRRAQFEVELKRDREALLDTALENLLTKRVLSAEAAKRKVSVDELIEIEVDSAAPTPTDEVVVQFYNANKSQLEGSLGDNAIAIRGYLRSQKRQTVFDTLIERLKKEYGAESYREPLRVAITTEGRPARGPADAPVTVVEFSDFECPYCRALLPTLEKITADYKEKVRVVYFQFPLSGIHRSAQKAAEASLCAFDQNKFWQMHDAMFSDQANLGVENLKQKASDLGVDSKAFGACLDSGKYDANIQEDVGIGVTAGVSGTPALFINGRALIGNQPYGEIQKIIDDELRRRDVR